MLARGLYAIVDVELTVRAGLDVVGFAEAVLDAHPAALQLRAKQLGAREHLRLLSRIVQRAETVTVPVYANDRPDLAILAGAVGVHVGQSDVAVQDVRRLEPRLQVGLSTATQEQVEQALAIRPDYIAIGPVFPTNSKLDADPAVGMVGLSTASRLARAAKIPLVAIGGIDHERAATVAAYADLGAAISALIPSTRDLGAVSARARSLHELLGGT
jgi:thiamine-phosphate pyrophosphorylase